MPDERQLWVQYKSPLQLEEMAKDVRAAGEAYGVAITPEHFPSVEAFLIQYAGSIQSDLEERIAQLPWVQGLVPVSKAKIPEKHYPT